MNAVELLARMIRRQLDSLFRAARNLPSDRLDWKPAPGARSALDQLQEVATSVDEFWGAHAERKVEWTPERFEKWQTERALLRDLDQLEKHARESHERLIEHILTVDPADLVLPVEMPFPGDFTLGDILGYYAWNAAYHEGQINYIGSLLEANA